MNKDLVDELFPHRDDSGRPSYRKNQFETIKNIIGAFDGGALDVVVEAPTGVGKTDIAKTVAMYYTQGFDVAKARARGAENELASFEIMAPYQAHMITSMKMLQDAYLNSRGAVSLVKGKSNYECKDVPGGTMGVISKSMGRTFSCQDAQFIHGKVCKEKCPYKAARRDAQWSPIALFNFESFLNQVSLADDIFLPRGILTIDEGHNTEEKLSKSMTVEFTEADFKRFGWPWFKPMDDSIEAAVEWISGVYELMTRHRNDVADEVSSIKKGKIVSFEDAKKQSGLVKKLQKLDEMISRSARMIKSTRIARPVKWVSDVEDDRVKFEPVSARAFVKNALLRYGTRRLHLSATFLDGNGVYRSSMKLHPDSTAYFAVPSTFPPNRRAVVKRYAGKLGYHGFNEKLPKIAEIIQKILNENKGVKGLIHCTSYKLSRQIGDMVKDRRLVLHESKTREEVVNKFTSSKEGDDVLVGVSLTEGYDFKDDLCRFQIIIKIPYPFPTKRVKARNESQPKYMDWRTCLTLVQSYGRGMRSESDWCKTYVLDERFDSFVSRNKRQLPGWFLEAI